MKRSIQILSLAAVWVTLATANVTAQGLNSGDPIEFFTNTADRMLHDCSQSWLMRDPSNYVTIFNLTNSFGITNIPVLVSNQFVYSPSIQRVLQVAANVYDAAATNFYPSVFRPIFMNDGANVFIVGYEQVASVTNANDSQLALPVDVTSLPLGVRTNVNVYGVPWIIGAKKGFPNFNEFSMENVVWIERKLQISRPSTNSPLSDYRTNQMYVMSISNSIGVECWNSYSSNYIPSGNLSIKVNDTFTTALSNLDTSAILSSSYFSTNYQVNITPPNFWPGTLKPWTNNTPNPSSFDIPLDTTVNFFTNEVYDPLTSTFIPQSQFGSNWNTGVFPLPQLALATTNRLQVFMLDGTHVIDYVQFAGPDNNTNLNPIIADYDPANPTHGLWNTNVSLGVPNGIINQIAYSESPQLNGNLLTTTDDRTWVNPPGSTVGQEIASFDAFLSPNHVGRGTDPNTGVTYKSTNLDLIVQVPFTPSRYVYGYTSWQANDPLVHYIASDLNFSGRDEVGGLETGWNQWNSSTTNLPANNLGHLNDRYQPWLTQHLLVPNTDPSSANLSIQDPLIYSSDDWNFPNGQVSNLNWIGQVHRGTPWQTVYLKSANILSEVNNDKTPIGLNTWVSWTGDPNTFDAVNSAPSQDWQLASLVVSLLNTNDFRALLSINNSDTNAWLALLNGLTAWTNSSTDFQISTDYLLGTIPPYDAITISSNSIQAGVIASAIQSARTSQPNQFFNDVGDILAAPQLTKQSPFLDLTDATQLSYGISDEAYEKIPSQLLPLLRSDSIGLALSINDRLTVQFTGYDNHSYAIDESSNLVDWVRVSTNYSLNGSFSFTSPAMTNSMPRFYRSVLLQ